MRRGIGLAAALAALLGGASASRADVLEIGARGAVWTAGGPAVPVPAEVPSPDGAPSRGTPPGTLPETLALHSAGPAQWQARVAELAAKYDLSPRLIEALVWQESRWRPDAVSPVGARGLAQLMPGTARELGVDPHVPDANLEGGARYLRQQLDRFEGDIEKALAAYNAGPGRVIAARGIPRIRETQNYVVSIMARLAAPVRQ
ncbi:MAG: lytic transglycosylase domain-containing protein [Novosphingobium sp.]|nr:lytic transglycosylase domain-containing protein [Novosphingobium sp.]